MPVSREITAPISSVPMPVTPMTPAAPAVITASPVTSPVQNQPISAPTRNRQKLLIFGVAVLLIFVSVTATIIATRNSLSSWDVVAAGNSASELSSDTARINTTAKSIVTASSLTDFSAISQTLSKSISDADIQYDILRTSPVLKDAGIATKFTVFRAKWGAYVNYVNGTSADDATLGPLLIELSSSQQSVLAASREASGNMAAELVQYQAVITAIERQTTSLSMQTAPDQQLMSQLQTYVKSSDAGIAQAQSDLTHNRGQNAITADITTIAAAATTFSNNQDAWTNSSYSTLQNLDPSSDLSNLISALNSLSKRIGQ
jgi:hypothetical protein